MSPPRSSSIVRATRLLIAVVGLVLAGDAGALDAGSPAPLFTAPALDGGSSVSLAAFRGKVVYLDFWASWCGPCLTSLPLIDGLREKFSGEDFQVVAVNVDRDPDRARRFLKRLALGYPSAMDPEGRLPERFEVQTMPTSFLIDRRGVIRHVQNGFRRGDVEPLRARIAELVASGRKR